MKESERRDRAIARFMRLSKKDLAIMLYDVIWCFNKVVGTIGTLRRKIK